MNRLACAIKKGSDRELLFLIIGMVKGTRLKWKWKKSVLVHRLAFIQSNQIPNFMNIINMIDRKFVRQKYIG